MNIATDKVTAAGAELYGQDFHTVLLAHLLKWRFQPERRGKSWRLTIQEQRYRVQERLAESPSLGHDVGDSFEKAYRYAVLRVARETPLETADLPPTCPFTPAQALDDTFLPDP